MLADVKLNLITMPHLLKLRQEFNTNICSKDLIKIKLLHQQNRFSSLEWDGSRQREAVTSRHHLEANYNIIAIKSQ